jgi:hypothetical protein
LRRIKLASRQLRASTTIANPREFPEAVAG